MSQRRLTHRDSMQQGGGASANAAEADKQQGPPERPWADAGPAHRQQAAQAASPTKQVRQPISGPMDRQFAADARAPGTSAAAPPAEAAAEAAAAVAAAPAADGAAQPAAAAEDFSFDVASPPRTRVWSVAQAAGRGGKGADVLPSFLQRAVVAAVPAEAAEAPEPLPLAPTQESPVKPQPRQAAGNGGSPILALPPMSQLDQSVLDSLPLVTRRELELAYGERRLLAHGRQLRSLSSTPFTMGFHTLVVVQVRSDGRPGKGEIFRGWHIAFKAFHAAYIKGTVEGNVRCVAVQASTGTSLRLDSPRSTRSRADDSRASGQPQPLRRSPLGGRTWPASFFCL